MSFGAIFALFSFLATAFVTFAGTAITFVLGLFGVVTLLPAGINILFDIFLN